MLGGLVVRACVWAGDRVKCVVARPNICVWRRSSRRGIAVARCGGDNLIVRTARKNPMFSNIHEETTALWRYRHW